MKPNRANLEIDSKLVDEAMRAGQHRTKKEAVTAALNEYIHRRKRLKVLELFGTIDFDRRYNHKADRRSKR